MRTTGEVVRWWLSRIEGDRARSAKYRDSMGSLMRRHVLPRMDKVPLRKLDRVLLDDKLVFPMHQELAPRTVQKALQGMRQAFRMAEGQGRIENNPLAGTTFRDFYKGKLRPKPAALSRVDLPGLVAHLVEVFNEDPAKGMLPLMMLAHGTRIAETLMARWSHVSLDERVWVIPEANTKSRREHVLPLTPQVLGLLARYRQVLPDSRLRTPWVFSVRGGGRMADTSAHALMREVSGRQWTSHDLRKLMRSSLADIGIDHMVGELLINHTLGVTTETYLTRDVMERRREALERWHDRLDELGFAGAHGVKVAAPALLSSGAKPERAGDCADSRVSPRGG
ncbi:tyrosine-type recombinase/integrase [Halopseudomonas bauzanensis]|uniref:Site-specific integrase n=1 Tax=Halopseudomonas bauzanensis TaxID=653930 RepID=A0A4U0YET7_9GAMM|nr:site-specific integrase [Halopseudomonas bauzanensis]TKA90382.1 site-specific integrase [Halopseudomonas bauzanensis]